MEKRILAFDFGASSGRAMLSRFEGNQLKVEEIHRFSNDPVVLNGVLYWDIVRMMFEIKRSISLALAKGGFDAIGIDTWGVDFGLIDKHGNLLGNPVCYRDARTEGIPEEVFKLLDERQHYADTGIQVMAINTLFQLYSMKQHQDAQLKVARQLLFMPDLFSYFLTGVANNEYCIASTSELLDRTPTKLVDGYHPYFGTPEHLFGEIILPGTVRGNT